MKSRILGITLIVVLAGIIWEVHRRLDLVEKRLELQELKIRLLGKASLDFLTATTRKWDAQQTDLLNASNALFAELIISLKTNNGPSWSNAPGYYTNEAGKTKPTH